MSVRLAAATAAVCVLLVAKVAGAQAPPSATTPTPADAAAVPTTPELAAPAPKTPLVEVHGYLQPQFGARYRPNAIDRDRWEYGGLSSRIGVILSGNPIEHFSYVMHLSLDVRSLLVISGVDVLDVDGNGTAEGITTVRTRAVATVFEEATVSYAPLSFLTVKLGAMRMPFTVALRSLNTHLLFSNRPGANEVFQSGSDQGVLVLGDWLGGRVQVSGGAFTGSSLNLLPANTDARGILYSARFDGNPLGKLPRAETDFEHGGFKLGVGAGTMYRDMTLYASRTGYELSELRDLRVSASVRLSAYGLFAQAEGFRRLATDNVNSRPDRATGGYVQASYFIPLGRMGLAPSGRLGSTTEDELALARRTTFAEAALAFYPRADQPKPESVRTLVQYTFERRGPDDDVGHAVVLQGQVVF